MKLLRHSLIFVLLASFALFSCKSSESTSPPAPKPRATYTGALVGLAVFFPALNTITVNLKFGVTNTNNVGANINSVHIQYLNNSVAILDEDYYPTSTQRIPQGGYYEWTYNKAYSYGGILPTHVDVTIYVSDDNGYSVTITSGPTQFGWS
ncbi:MAG: hypothetical protein WAU81_00430 [Candidatus Aminicenantales bacterium]